LGKTPASRGFFLFLLAGKSIHERLCQRVLRVIKWTINRLDMSFISNALPLCRVRSKAHFGASKQPCSGLVLPSTFCLPWLPWARSDAPSQAVLFDIPGRRYYLFDLTVFPQDIFWLAILLFMAAVLLFFATALVGRAFCGYFCFQTLWTDAFIWLEHLIQGERPARLRLAREPWGN
jgi:hypothetical protein